jgi:hypothetical protein
MCYCCWHYYTLFLTKSSLALGLSLPLLKEWRLSKSSWPDSLRSAWPQLPELNSDQIRVLAREFATAESAVCYGRIGVSTQEFGGVCQWLINVLNTVSGNLDSPGGAMFTLPAFDPLSAPESLAPRGSFGRWHSRVRKRTGVW